MKQRPALGLEVVKEEKKERDYVGNGWHFEADEVARCVRDGKLESALWSHDKSVLLMETFDEVSEAVCTAREYIGV